MGSCFTVVSILERGTLTLHKCIRPQKEIATQLLINLACVVVPSTPLLLASSGQVVFDSTLRELERISTTLASAVRSMGMPLRSVPTLTVAHLAWLPQHRAPQQWVNLHP